MTDKSLDQLLGERLKSLREERGLSLAEDEFVVLGSLVQTNWVEAGDEVVIANNPLGEVRATFVVASSHD